MLIEHMAKGLSFECFGAVVDCSEPTLYEWLKAHPEFSKSQKRAKAKCKIFWEQAGIDGMHKGKDFNAAVWIFNMKNRFNWKDKLEHDIPPETLSAMFEKLENKLKKDNNNASK